MGLKGALNIPLPIQLCQTLSDCVSASPGGACHARLRLAANLLVDVLSGVLSDTSCRGKHKRMDTTPCKAQCDTCTTTSTSSPGNHSTGLADHAGQRLYLVMALHMSVQGGRLPGQRPPSSRVWHSARVDTALLVSYTRAVFP